MQETPLIINIFTKYRIYFATALIVIMVLSIALLPSQHITQAADAPPLSSSTFDNSAEGWAIIGDAQGPSFSVSDGNPGGYIYASDKQQGAVWYWQSSANFLGDKSAAYGKLLTFDLKQSITARQDVTPDDVVLIGAGITLWFDTLINPGVNWTNYTVLLNEKAGWVKRGTNQAPTQAEMQQVLASLTALQIRGEFSTEADKGSLDNVLLGTIISTQANSISTFEKGGDWWGVVGDVQGPIYASQDGNPPDGYIYAVDKVTGASWYWKAPAKFLGDKSAAYRKTLTFDLKQSAIDRQVVTKDDLIISGGGLTLWFDFSSPGTYWTTYSVLLSEDAGWKKANTDQPPTQAEMLKVLTTLSALQIRGEFRDGSDNGSLDNVQMEDSTTSCVAPNGLNICALRIGDILLRKTNANLDSAFKNTIGGTYFSHSAIFSGDRRVIEAVGNHVPLKDQVAEQDISTNGWLGQDIYDWVVIRPNTTLSIKQAAVYYARNLENPNRPIVSYNVFANRDSQEETYCSLLVWQAYKQSGLDLEVDRGTLTDIITLSRFVTPDDLFYSSGLLSQRSTRVQSRLSSSSQKLWRWTLWILSPAHLMLTDPQGRRSGFDSETGTVLNEIPGVIYSGPTAVRETFAVTNLGKADGNWKLTIAGFATGDYHIEAGSVDDENPLPQVIVGSTSPGKIEHFTIMDPYANGSINIEFNQKIFLPVIRR